MRGVWLRVMTWARANWGKSIPIVLVVAIAAGAALALAIGTRRTESAPDRYTAAYGGDLSLLIYQPLGEPLTDAVRNIDGVRFAEGITFVPAFPFDKEGNLVFDTNPFAGMDEGFGARLLEGRFTNDDAPDEFTVNRTGAALMHGVVGETYDFVSYSQEQTDQNAFGTDEFEGPRFRATLVGITASATDFDDPTSSMIFSQAFLKKYPDVGVVVTLIGVLVEDGVSADSVLEAARALPGGEEVFQIPGRIVSEGARDAVDFQSRALWIVTIVTLVAAALVAAQLVIRHLRSTSGDRRPLLALGYRPRQIAGEAAIEGALLGTAAAVVAAAIAVAGSAVFPLGAVGEQPDSGPRVDLPVLLIGGLGLIVATSAAAALSAGRGAVRERTRARRIAVADRLADAGAGPSVVNGVRFALARQSRRGAPPLALAAGIAVALTGLVGALVVGTSLIRVTDEHARWGENYDALFGNPFIPTDHDLVTPALADPSVKELTEHATSGSLVINGEDVEVWAFESERGGIVPVTTGGRTPSGVDEIALGRKAAHRLGVGIGDVVGVDGPEGGHAELRVVGYVATPGQAGDGAALTFEAYSALVPDTTPNLLLVNFNSGPTQEDLDRISELTTTPPGSLEQPTSVIGLDRVTAAPFLLAIVLILFALATMAQNLVSTVREHRYDLAVLRALGADRRQLRGIVHWHATTVAIIGLVIALPIGAVAGARLFTLVANDVGVVSAALISPLLLAAVAAGVLAAANLAAVWPSIRATRVHADTLRRS